MKRVASLYLPEWAVERHRRRTAPTAPPPDLQNPGSAPGPATLATHNEGWRPGARWAREPLPPFRAMPPDEGGVRVRESVASTGAGFPGEALVLSRKVGSRVEIAAAAPAARALGIVAGMALTQARACVPELVIRDARPERDRADLHALAVLLARRWCPIVAISDDDGLLLDLTGVSHLHGGEVRLARRLVRLLAQHGVTAHVAVADTAGAAWAIARSPRCPAWTILEPGAHIDALAPMPVAALRLEETTVGLLQRLGIVTIGAFAALPRAPLVRRFGKTAALRLDQATGRAPEPLMPVEVAEPVVVSQRFAEPIATAEAIEHWLGQLVPRLTDELARAGLGVRALVLAGTRIDNRPQVMRIGFARPSRDPAHILRLVLRRVEEIEPGYGIDALSFHVMRADPLTAETIGGDLAGDGSDDLAPLVDTLANRIGAFRIWRARPAESDVPERSTDHVDSLDLSGRSSARLKQDDVRLLDYQEHYHAWHSRWPRPVRLFARPELLDHVIAELPDHPPRRFTWRGRSHRVIRADGPERIYGEWWKHAAERDGVRDYFQVEDEAGARFWMFRRGDGVRAKTGNHLWYLHGAFG